MTWWVQPLPLFLVNHSFSALCHGRIGRFSVQIQYNPTNWFSFIWLTVLISEISCGMVWLEGKPAHSSMASDTLVFEGNMGPCWPHEPMCHCCTLLSKSTVNHRLGCDQKGNMLGSMNPSRAALLILNFYWTKTLFFKFSWVCSLF